MSGKSGVLLAFAANQAAKLSGLSVQQLAHWNRIGFFAPTHGAGRDTLRASLYSFKDVVGLRTLGILRNKHNVSLPHLRAVAARLQAHSATPWADLRLGVWNRRVQFDDADAGRARGVLDGQYVLFPLKAVAEEVRREADRMRQREPSQAGQIEKRRAVARNAPVFAGTRIPVAAVRRYLDAGFTSTQIVAEYPTLTEADVAAVQEGKPRIAA